MIHKSKVIIKVNRYFLKINKINNTFQFTVHYWISYLRTMFLIFAKCAQYICLVYSLYLIAACKMECFCCKLSTKGLKDLMIN